MIVYICIIFSLQINVLITMYVNEATEVMRGNTEEHAGSAEQALPNLRSGDWQ